VNRAIMVLALALIAGFLLQGAEADHRSRANDRSLPATLDPASGMAVLGGLRSPVIAALWMDCIGLERRREWWALRARYQLIAELEPRIASIWGFLGWNQAHNLADRMPYGSEERSAWILEAVGFYERGLELNPSSVRIRLDLGLVLARKVCSDAGADRGYTETHDGADASEAAASMFRSLLEESPDTALFASWIAESARLGALPATRRRETEIAVRRWRSAARGYREIGREADAAYCERWSELAPDLPGDPIEARRWLLARLLDHRDEPEVRELLFPARDAHRAAFEEFLMERWPESIASWRVAARTYSNYDGWDVEKAYAEAWAAAIEALPKGTALPEAARRVLAAIADYLPRIEEPELRYLAGSD